MPWIQEPYAPPATQKVIFNTYDIDQANVWMRIIQMHICDEKLRNKPGTFEFGHITLHDVILVSCCTDQEPSYLVSRSPKTEIELAFIHFPEEKKVEKTNLLRLIHEPR